MRNSTTILQWALVLAIGLNFQSLSAQVNALFSTGGEYNATGNKVTLYSYDPAVGTESIVDSIPGDFSNDLVVDSNHAYLHVGRASGHPAGTDAIYQYDLATMSPLDSLKGMNGIQHFQVHENYLIITKGFGAAGNYVEIFNTTNLAAGSVYSDTSIGVSTSGIAVVNDTLHVSFTNNDSGNLARIDLSGASPSFVDAMPFDTLSKGIGELITDGQYIYAVSEAYDASFNFQYAGLTLYEPATGSFWTDTNSTGAANPFHVANDSLLVDLGNPVQVFNRSDSTNSNWFSKNYTAAAWDKSNDRFFLQNTDFFSTGSMVVVDESGQVLDSVSTDISGTALALYEDISTNTQLVRMQQEDLEVYPTVFQDRLQVKMPSSVKNGTLTIRDELGRIVFQKSVTDRNIAVQGNGLPSGNYFVTLNDDRGGIFHSKVVKQ